MTTDVANGLSSQDRSTSVPSQRCVVEGPTVEDDGGDSKDDEGMPASTGDKLNSGGSTGAVTDVSAPFPPGPVNGGCAAVQFHTYSNDEPFPPGHSQAFFFTTRRTRPHKASLPCEREETKQTKRKTTSCLSQAPLRKEI